MSGFARNLMLTIDQISQLTGVRKSTLRYWEKSFQSFLKPARTHSNRRKYSLEDLDRVKTIKELLEQEHLTTFGVRLRLEQIISSPGAEVTNRQDRLEARGSASAPQSIQSKDSSIQ
jgi:DNA-binding transcriptional MerR regulator